MDADLRRGAIAVVTGATGFIGSALCTALVERGMRVRCLTRARPRARDGRGDVEWHVVDWSDARALERCPAFDGAEIVVHLAGVTKALSAAAFRAGNVQPAEALAGAVVRRGLALSRFVLVSSQAAAGPAPSLDAPRREADTPAPLEAYGESKLAAEQIITAYHANLPWTIVRPSSVYGPRDVDFLEVFKQVRRGVWIYPATRDRWLSLVHVDDVVRGILRAAVADRAIGRTYFLTREPPVSWRDVYVAAAAAVGARRFAEVNLPQPMVNAAGVLGSAASRATRRVGLVNAQKVALGRPDYWICSSELAKRELGWVATVELEHGLRQTADWYREHRWL
jgi:nucleoside-diphosphate-sugar epimerase